MHTVHGEFMEVSPPERLAYTWSWDEGPEAAMAGSERSLVVVEFVEDGDGTEVVLTHTGFTSAESRDNHEHGWRGCIVNLERRVFA